MIVGLIVGFAVAALIVRGDGGGGSSAAPVDTQLWCSEADVLEGLRPLFDGSAPSATADDFEAAKDTIFEIEMFAPTETVALGFARLADLSLIMMQRFADAPWPDVYAIARGEVDEAVVDQAIDDIAREMAACGLTL